MQFCVFSRFRNRGTESRTGGHRDSRERKGVEEQNRGTGWSAERSGSRAPGLQEICTGVSFDSDE